jgi:hypothetical protein
LTEKKFMENGEKAPLFATCQKFANSASAADVDLGGITQGGSDAA